MTLVSELIKHTLLGASLIQLFQLTKPSKTLYKEALHGVYAQPIYRG